MSSRDRGERTGGSVHSESGPQHPAADPVVGNQKDEHQQEHAEIEPVDSPGQPVGHQDQGRLEMDKNKVDENQPEISDLSSQVKHLTFFSPSRWQGCPDIGARSGRNGLFRYDPKAQENERLKKGVNKK